MEKKKLQKKIEKAESLLKELKDELTKEKETERIRVPDCIKIEVGGLDWGLISGNGKMALIAREEHGGTPRVIFAGNPNSQDAYIPDHPFYLEPCKRGDLEQGDIAFRSMSSGSGAPSIKNLFYYAVILNDYEYAYWYGNDMMIGNRKEWIWYKVVK